MGIQQEEKRKGMNPYRTPQEGK